MKRNIPQYFRGKLISAVVVTACASADAASPAVLSGHVVDDLGAIIPDVHVYLRTDFSGGWSKASFDANSTTDRTGLFTLKIGPGFYDLCIMADGFTPECRKLFVRTHATAQEFRLKASPEVVKRTADTFR